jgi:hypothetical protein
VHARQDAQWRCVGLHRQGDRDVGRASCLTGFLKMKVITN